MEAFMTEPDPTHSRYPHTKDGETKKADKLVDDSESDDDDDLEVSEEKKDFLDNEKAVGVKRDPKTKTTVRNLRIREDVAKYLRNLDPDSGKLSEIFELFVLLFI
jgi:hypothetical protein